jgi:AmmeMemoRadiSam system protein B/AmmeMemoRadiSam system protein A
MHKNHLIIMIILLNISFSCSSQDKDGDLINRQAYAAGRFYADNPQQLKNDLSLLFGNATPMEYKNVRAIISPHAGYVYSGEVAASGFNQVDPGAVYDNIFIIASSHRHAFKGASIYSRGNYITPLGEVKVNRDLAEKLINGNKIFSFKSEAHSFEHSLEVQLPFLQYHLQNTFSIIPIVIGTQDYSDCELIAKALEPYFNKHNLFVISSDFSHYPAYDDAVKTDKRTADAIITNSPMELMEVLEENKEENIPNLATSLCGWSSVFTLLNITRDKPGFTYHEVKYMNSGDQHFGDKSGVVGYYSIVVTDEGTADKGFELSDRDKKDLLHIARTTLESYIDLRKIPQFNAEDYSSVLLENCGAFVTLNIDHQLRGCIGRFTPDVPLYQVVKDMAIASSTQDNRFPPVSPSELKDIDIEISVLTPIEQIESIDEIELGKHGIYIIKGYSSGTFLPQVATSTGWTKEEFLGHCARDKARIGWNGWKDAEIYIYEAIVFSEEDTP